MTGKAAVSIDISQVRAPERLKEWRKWVPALFPGLEVVSVARRPVGLISQIRLGNGIISRVVVSDQHLRNHPSLVEGDATFAIILQHEGLSAHNQGGGECRIGPGEFCLLDGGKHFTVQSTGLSRISILQLPRTTLLARFPALSARVAQVFPIERSDTLILRDLLTNIVRHANDLSEDTGMALIAAIGGLLASLPAPGGTEPRQMSWRIKQALADIEARLDDATLTASDIADAQSIGRRQLDALFAGAMKSTVSVQITERRLAQAAQDLCDAAMRSRSITEIAFAAGFSDSAHFTRAFRRRFGQTPRAWRKRA